MIIDFASKDSPIIVFLPRPGTGEPTSAKERRTTTECYRCIKEYRESRKIPTSIISDFFFFFVLSGSKRLLKRET